MSFTEITMWIMAIGAVIGGLDRIFGNRLGLGEKFEEGFNAMGPLALGMVGIVCLSPIISNLMAPVIAPVLSLVGADPAIFGSVLANDMGGYPLSMSLAINEQAGMYSGLVVASMLGSTLVFSIPVGLSLIEHEDKPYFAEGMLIGMITIPIGSIAGGLMAGYDPIMVVLNTIPVIIISILLALGLKWIPDGMITGCIWFGRFIVALITVGLTAAAFEYMTGIVIIPGMSPIEDAMTTIGTIAIVLLGTFPILSILIKVLDTPLNAIGRRIGLDAVSAGGMFFSLANSIPVFRILKDMSNRGKVVNMAWLVCSAGALGDHLGFTAGVHPEAIAPVVLSKLFGGAVAVVIALFMTRNMSEADKLNPATLEAAKAERAAEEIEAA